MRFRSYKDGSELMLSPEESMSVQAALGSDIALVFDECTPFHADREYTARSTERTHRWLQRSLDWHDQHGPEKQAVFGIIQGGTYEDLRLESCQAVSESGVDGIAIGGTLGRDKAEMAEVLGFTVPALPVEAPKHLLGIGEVDDLMRGIGLGIDVFDCAVPTRLARHGMGLAPVPDQRFRVDLRKGYMSGDHRPVVEGCPCVGCQDYDRDYLNYISRSEELTAVRVLVEHNLTYMERLMAGARDAISAGTFDRYSAAILSGSRTLGNRMSVQLASVEGFARSSEDPGAERPLALRPRRISLRAARPERFRQDHCDPDPARPDPGQQRQRGVARSEGRRPRFHQRGQADWIAD
ncbi:MAG: tRNA-guanine transglycosylase [Solirubrobacterales bacterium]|nr:tRNA-guanine transglycosylase [Solirubrobacterales bacterium]